LFLAGLAVLSYGLAAETGARRLAVALYLAWTLLELPVTFRLTPAEADAATDRTRGAGDSRSDDRGSMPLYGLARAAVVGAALFGPASTGPAAWQIAATAVFALGIVLRLGAVVQLGRFYSHRVRTLPSHTIVQTGLYRFLRHPAYAGMILAHAGFVGLFPSPLSVAALAGLLVPAVVYRILVEERSLMALSSYRSYARGRKRMIPVVW
jgi:protein-S-isoprenylcysteine O-methyltransferase Ste14